MSRRGWLLFAALCLIWGIPYLLIKVAVTDLSPATLVLARTAIGAALLLPLAAVRGQLRPLRARWGALLLYTVVEICLPWYLLFRAEQRLSSALTGLLIAVVPLMGALIARFSGTRERLEPRRLVGLLVGLAGVATLVTVDVGSADRAAVGLVGLVALGYAVGPVILDRRLADLPGLGVVAGSLGLASLLSLPFGLAAAPTRWPSAPVLAAVAALAVVCTALAFLLFFQLISEIGPARATVITYVNPAVAVALGVGVLGESFTTSTAVGFTLILGGSVLGTYRRPPLGRPLQPALGPRDLLPWPERTHRRSVGTGDTPGGAP